MSNEIARLLIAGVLLLVPVVGCNSTQRHESDWADEMAANVTYGAPQPTSTSAEPAAGEWVCPMHPSFKQFEPGKCSICGMGLVRSDGRSSASSSDSGSGHSHSSHSGHSGSSGCGHCGG